MEEILVETVLGAAINNDGTFNILNEARSTFKYNERSYNTLAFAFDPLGESPMCEIIFHPIFLHN